MSLTVRGLVGGLTTPGRVCVKASMCKSDREGRSDGERDRVKDSTPTDMHTG